MILRKKCSSSSEIRTLVRVAAKNLNELITSGITKKDTF